MQVCIRPPETPEDPNLLLQPHHWHSMLLTLAAGKNGNDREIKNVYQGSNTL